MSDKPIDPTCFLCSKSLPSALHTRVVMLGAQGEPPRALTADFCKGCLLKLREVERFDLGPELVASPGEKP